MRTGIHLEDCPPEFLRPVPKDSKLHEGLISNTMTSKGIMVKPELFRIWS